MILKSKELIESAPQVIYEGEALEIFDMKDSGVIYDTNQTYPNNATDNESNNLTEPINSSQDDYVNTSLDSSNRSTDLTESTNSGFIKATYSELVTIYTNARGEKIQRSGGSVAWRNNNPGNIRKSKVAYSFGAIGETDKWAVFPDEETGLKAIMKLLKSKTLLLIIKKNMFGLITIFANCISHASTTIN